ncbi:MAG: baseplate J/gp47 family protein [Ruminococcus sp.]
MRFYALEDTILPANQATQKVLVQAEEIGTAYNVETGKITVSMVHIEGDATVTNEEDWITNEGQGKRLRSTSENAALTAGP